MEKTFVNAQLTETGFNKPYFEGILEINESKRNYDGDYIAKVLSTEMFDKSQTYKARSPQLGDYISADIRQVKGIDKDAEEYGMCEKLSKEFGDIHKNAPYIITGRIYEEMPEHTEDYQRLELTDEKEWMPEGVHSIDDARKWLLENHPDYYMGCSISQNCPSGDYYGGAVPCPEYEKGMWETFEGRREWTKKEADMLGCTLGKSEYNKEEDKTMRDKPTLKVLIGLPASGKTTYSQKAIEQNPDTVWMSSDAIRREWEEKGIEYKQKDVFIELDKRSHEALKEGKDIIYDATSLNDWERKNALNVAKGLDVKTEAVVFNVPINECMKRNDTRTGVAHVPDEVYDRMVAKFEAVDPKMFDKVAYTQDGLSMQTEYEIDKEIAKNDKYPDRPYHLMIKATYDTDIDNKLENNGADMYDYIKENANAPKFDFKNPSFEEGYIKSEINKIKEELNKTIDAKIEAWAPKLLDSDILKKRFTKDGDYEPPSLDGESLESDISEEDTNLENPNDPPLE